MTLKLDAKFKGKLACGWKNGIRNLVKFHASSWKSKNLHFDGLLLTKAYKDLDKKVQKSYVSWHWRAMQNLKQNRLLVPKMACWILLILMSAVESLKICSLMYYFCQKHVKFRLKKYSRIISYDIEDVWKLWKKEIDFLFKKWHEEFREFQREKWKV